MICGSISSWCSVLNSEDRLKQIKEANEVAAILGDIEAEQQKEQEEQRKKKKEEEAERQRRKESCIRVAQEKKAKGLKECAGLMQMLHANGANHIKKMTVSQLKLLLQYQYNDSTFKQKGIKKESLQKAVEELYAGVVKTPDDDDNVPDENVFPNGAVLI